MVYVGCSLGVKEEKACWALINSSSDGMGCGREGTESSSVHAGCSLETKGIGELSSGVATPGHTRACAHVKFAGARES